MSFVYFIPSALYDYTLSFTSITFPSGLSQAAIQCINISIVDDNNFEEDVEIFSVSLNSRDFFINIVVDSAEVEIADNESKRSGRKKGVRVGLELNIFREGTQSGGNTDRQKFAGFQQFLERINPQGSTFTWMVWVHASQVKFNFEFRHTSSI